MIDSAKPDKPRAVPIDVGAQQIGRVYAAALLGAAETSGKTAQIVEELDWLVGVLDEFPDLESILASAMIKQEEKSALLDRVFGSRLSPLLLDFLKVVAHHGRLGALRAIRQEAGTRYDELRGRIRVRLSSATELDGPLSSGLVNSLRNLLGGEPEVEPVIQPSLIGGIVLRVGDTVYDGSVARQLEQVREQMITRSVHEIQSRRDRFRSTS